MSKILITGCGLSGTHFTRTVLRACDVDVGHEIIREDGAVSWLHASWMHPTCWRQNLTCGNHAWTGGNICKEVDGDVHEFDTVIRQIRNPRKIATSYALDAHGASWRFARQVIEGVYDIEFPWPPKDDIVAAGVCYTWFWLKLAGYASDWTYRVEDMPDVLETLVSVYGGNINKVSQALDDANKREGSRQKRKGYDYWTWKEITAVPWGCELHDFAQQFGYE